MPPPEDQRRSAERVELAKPLPAMVGDVPASITEISLINCRLEHNGKIAMGANVTLLFEWGGEKIRVKGKVTRSEMRPVGGKLGFVSALQFSESIDNAPPPVRQIIAALLRGEEPAAMAPPPPIPAPPTPPRPPDVAPALSRRGPAESRPHVAPPPPAPAESRPHVPPPPPAEEEIEEIEAEAELPAVRFIQCTLSEGKWTKKEVTDSRQPREGFTMILPDNPSDVDQFCKTYEVADLETRRMIRLSFELAIAALNG